MGRLASQTAAHKLGHILGVLVIPIVVLLSLYLYEAKGRIDRLERAQSGLELATLVAGSEPFDARATAVLAELDLPSTLLVDATRDTATVLSEILRAAGLNDGGDPAGRALVETAYGVAGSLAQAKGAVAKLLNTPMGQQGVLAQELTIFEQLQTAGVDDVARLRSAVFTGLQERLSARKVVLWRNLLLLTFAGLASAATGVGLAVLMMRSTLNRLDEVEKAKAEANEARREAELLTVRYSNINADISSLNQELAFKMKELKNAQDELIKRGRMEQLGQLTATIAHEIRNPLGAIRTSAFLLQRKTASMGDDLSGLLQRINNGVNRCDTIISQLLDYSRTKEVNSSLALLDEWVLKVVRDEAQRLPPVVTIECALGLEDVKVAFDPTRMQRAVINLINNACEAMGHGESDSNAGKQNLRTPSITITTLKQGDHAAIRIVDNGPGMTTDVLARVREPLFTTKSFGTGLGLPAVEQIMAQHQGRLDIASEPGRGSVMTLLLPLVKRMEPRDAA